MNHVLRKRAAAIPVFTSLCVFLSAALPTQISPGRAFVQTEPCVFRRLRTIGSQNNRHTLFDVGHVQLTE